MVDLSLGQKKELATFFNNLAVAWLTAGIVTPLFSQTSQEIKIIYIVSAFFLTCIFLSVSLILTEEVNSL